MSDQCQYPPSQNDRRDQTKTETEQFEKQLSVFNCDIIFVPQRFGNEPNYD